MLCPILNRRFGPIADKLRPEPLARYDPRFWKHERGGTPEQWTDGLSEDQWPKRKFASMMARLMNR